MSQLNIRFHNPNTNEETKKHVTKIFIEASKVRLENALKEVTANAKIEKERLVV